MDFIGLLIIFVIVAGAKAMHSFAAIHWLPVRLYQNWLKNEDAGQNFTAHSLQFIGYGS
ncbi:hypothetical protein ACFQHU_11935 [Pseudobowmanella zhangzhouensis]|uniref:Uncharacterized protein n=1 Tax=Pseudobowmanella zhangzhouensis TaxID=1537679 RepID=A0ABW1XPP7_9ALTE